MMLGVTKYFYASTIFQNKYILIHSGTHLQYNSVSHITYVGVLIGKNRELRHGIETLISHHTHPPKPFKGQKSRVMT